MIISLELQIFHHKIIALVYVVSRLAFVSAYLYGS